MKRKIIKERLHELLSQTIGIKDEIQEDKDNFNNDEALIINKKLIEATILIGESMQVLK